MKRTIRGTNYGEKREFNRILWSLLWRLPRLFRKNTRHCKRSTKRIEAITIRQICWVHFHFFVWKDFKEYEECYKVLGAMVKFRCRKGCRNGGGSPFCKIRICAQKKEIEGCWLCDESEGCKKLEFLVSVHGDAHIKNLRVLKRKGKDGFLEGKRLWYSKPKR